MVKKLFKQKRNTITRLMIRPNFFAGVSMIGRLCTALNELISRISERKRYGLLVALDISRGFRSGRRSERQRNWWGAGVGGAAWTLITADLSAFEFRIGEKVPPFNKLVKCLGVEIDPHLNFNAHLGYLQDKTNRLIRTINELNHVKSDLQIK